MKTSEAKLASARAWKARNAERIKELNRARNKAIRADPEQWEKKKALQRMYAKRDREKNRKYDRSRDRVKKRARTMVRNHIYRGTLKRLPCEVCGEPKTGAHHDDYSKPLDVRWLCPKHHAELHKRISNEK